MHRSSDPSPLSRLTQAAARGTHDDGTPHAELSAALKEQLQPLVPLRELDPISGAAGAETRTRDTDAAPSEAGIETILASGRHVACRRASTSTASLQEMTAEIMGYGLIEPYLHDDSISEVMVNGPNRIYVNATGCCPPCPRDSSAPNL